MHLAMFAQTPEHWRDDALAKKWSVIRKVRGVVTSALEIERANKNIGSSLEAAPRVFLQLDELSVESVRSVDFAEICIVSDITIETGDAPYGAFYPLDLSKIAVLFKRAEGAKCARSWKVSKEIGSDKEFPDITPRDAEAVREWQTRFGKSV